MAVIAISDLPLQIMLGPFVMGSTEDVEGTYQIVYKLNILIEWANDEYRKWFQTHVLAWCQKRIEARRLTILESRDTTTEQHFVD